MKRIYLLPGLLFLLGIILFIKGLSAQVNITSVSPSADPAASSSSILGIQTTSSGTLMTKVTRVVDGDTFAIEVSGKEEKVRYIGIDTPETVDPHRPVGCFGHEASDEDKSLILGKEVELVPDKGDRDKFGRLLRYVYLKLDNGQYLFVNDYLVREGYARVDTIAPNTKFVNEFTQAQQEAQTQKRGLWLNCSS